MVAEEIEVTLSGGAPWGFRLQGGAEHKKPLQVAKVRRRSKACRAGLRESDELLSINDKLCGGLSHAQAMSLIDGGPGTLHIRVKRAPSAFQSVVLLTRSPSPRIDKEYRSAAREVRRGALMSPTVRDGAPRRESVTSPPDSEAYYGETDSDADTAYERQRRQKRRSPSGSPAKFGGKSSPDETSEMSGYESAPDAQVYHNSSLPQQSSPPGVARREVIYQPPRPENSPENSSSSMDDQSPIDGPGTNEMDSGFQEPPNLPPLVSPDRAKEALLLASRGQLVPMVGPVDNPVSEELTVTYMDKAKQAKLHRGESVQEKQVKEARNKCRNIAALLTDAPNPHSKGVLMFKKRRQRAKKYTLTCFGSVEGSQSQDGTTEEEDDEEGIFPTSESELDEDGFTSAPESAWDSDYLEILERKTPTVGAGEMESPGLNATSGKGAQLFEQQRRRAEEHATRAAPITTYAEASPMQGPPPAQPDTPAAPVMAATPTMPIAPAMTTTPANYSVMNGDCNVVSRASVVMSPPMANGGGAGPAGSVLNRTAQPFAAGFVSHRAATTPVVFRPSVPKKSPPQPAAPAQPTPLSFSVPSSEVKRAVSTTSLYIPPRPAPRNAPHSILSPPSSVAAAPFSPFSPSPTPAIPFSHPNVAAPPLGNPPAQAMPFSPPPRQAASFYPPPGPAAPFTPPSAQAASFCPPPDQAKPLSPPAIQATSVYLPPAQAVPFSPPPAQVASFYPPPGQAPSFSSPPAQSVPFSPPATQATSVYSPSGPTPSLPSPPAQSVPLSPPATQATSFCPPPGPTPSLPSPPAQSVSLSPPATQATSVYPPSGPTPSLPSPPAQSVPLSPPATQATSVYPPSGPTPSLPSPPAQSAPLTPLATQATSVYPSSGPTPSLPSPLAQSAPLSPPATQATSVYPPSGPTPSLPSPPAQSVPLSPPALPAVPFSPLPDQAKPLSPPATKATSVYLPPAQTMPFSPPPVQSMPFPPPSAHATSYYPPPAQATPVSSYSTQAMPFPPPVQITSLTFAPAQSTPFSPPPAPSTTCPTPISTTPFSPSSTPAGPLSPPVSSTPSGQPCTMTIPPPPTPKVSFNPYVTVASTTPSPPVSATPAPAPISAQYPAAANSAEDLASREQRISVPASRTGILQEARRRGSKKPMFSKLEEKKHHSPNPELLSMVQNLDEKPRGGNEPGFESGPEEDSLNLGAEACNFMQALKSRLPPPPVAPKPQTAPVRPQFPQMGGKGAELFARRQSRMDRYVVDKTAPAPPRLPSPTPSLPNHWKYSPNIRAPPPISYNPLLSPSCPPGAQRGAKASQTTKVTKKSTTPKQSIKPLDVMSRQPYQLNSAMFTYGGNATPAAAYQQSQNVSLTAPKQIPIKAARVHNIKRFSTPTPMSAPASLSPTVIAPRSATTLGEPMWRPDVVSPPPAPLSPPPAPAGALPALPKIYCAPVPNPDPGLTTGSTCNGARQWFKSAPELSPLSSAVSGSSLSVRVPRPRFSTSSMGIQANVWRPGSVLY